MACLLQDLILIAHGCIRQKKKSEIVQASDRHPPDADKFLVLSNARRRF
jgi:hypothetical protein